MSDEEEQFVLDVQKRCSYQSMTMVRDRIGAYPLSPEKTPKLGICVICQHEPALEDARALKAEFEKRGFIVEYTEGEDMDKIRKDFYQRNDHIIYAAFSRPFRPIGFLDYSSKQAKLIQNMFMEPNSVEKISVASFGSPYFGSQYFQKVQTYVNAYSMLECSVKAFVAAACGETDFPGKSPVAL